MTNDGFVIPDNSGNRGEWSRRDAEEAGEWVEE